MVDARFSLSTLYDLSLSVVDELSPCPYACLLFSRIYTKIPIVWPLSRLQYDTLWDVHNGICIDLHHHQLFLGVARPPARLLTARGMPQERLRASLRIRSSLFTAGPIEVALMADALTCQDRGHMPVRLVHNKNAFSRHHA